MVHLNVALWRMHYCKANIESVKDFKSLGVFIDSQSSFWQHVFHN